ncbi:hypothetical protein TSOC_002188 [Tetrabaena socialis]|uniref:Ankyrin repeat domain-containing protein n=1 Tax=Tetrabaena socialis TaxID=47790 RepID=A0A2J8AEU6_9CHLO|nr:hypothetical protein TSOC_002188 [Tetrabaena socialis]|eukprot:PNH11026.1 hypothetical protein TSOC_002188 [Tetrabaena socialis]
MAPVRSDQAGGGHPSVQCSMELQRAHKRQQRFQSPASPPQQQHSDPSRIWLPDIVQRVAVSLTPNEVAGTLRLVNKATAAQLSTPQHTTVWLSQPVPHHAFVGRWAGPDSMRTLEWKQRHELTRLTACSGSIANLEVLLARDDMPAMLKHDVFVAAAAAGQLGVCIWLRERGCCRNDRLVLRAAARTGQQAVCEWLLANGCPEADTYGNAAAKAAEGGHVSLMDWLLLHAGSAHVESVLAGAAVGCDLHDTYVDTLPGGQPEQYSPFLLSAAAGSPTADWQAKVEWLEARGYPTSCACWAAAARPHMFPRLQWLRQRGYPLDEFMAGCAAGAGNVEALQYVLDEGVRGGHVAVLEMLDARGAHRSGQTVRTAAAAAHLPAVAWLVEKLGAAAALTARVFEAAARAGSMELLRWLRARGCPWDATVFAAAAEGGSEEQLEWLVEQGCPMGVGAGGDSDRSSAAAADPSTQQQVPPPSVVLEPVIVAAPARVLVASNGEAAPPAIRQSARLRLLRGRPPEAEGDYLTLSAYASKFEAELSPPKPAPAPAPMAAPELVEAPAAEAAAEAPAAELTEAEVAAE